MERALATKVAGAMGRLRPGEDLPVVAALNGLLQDAWRSGALPEPALDFGRLARIAARKERRDPEGGPWEEALHRLIADLRKHAELNPLGRTIAHGLLVRCIRQRIRAERLLRAEPRIRSVPIERPVIILGQMRSGTTRMHRLLACDPRFAFTRLYETLQPVPSSALSGRAATYAIRRFLHACNPALRTIHPARTNDAEEEFGLHAVSFHGAMFEAQWAVPTFARWSEQRDLASVYDEFHRLLTILRWRRKDPPGKVQLLKAPQFMQDMPAALRAFPDARIIRLQRACDEVIASSASLVWHQHRIQSANADSIRIGAEWKRKTELREQRAGEALALLPPASVLTVDYDATNRDWRRQIRRVYEFLDMRPDAAAMQAMARAVGRSEHIGHRYSAGQFGLQATSSEGC